MTYWHCDTCKHPLSEWDAPCPRCRAEEEEEEEPTFPGVLIPILVTLLLFGALFL